MRRGSVITICLAVGLMSQVRLLADVVELKNGDRLTGELQSLLSGRLALKTSYAGTVRIDWAQVASVSTVERYVVELTSGSSAVGPIRSGESEAVTIESTPPQSVSLSSIAAIRQDPTLVEKPGFLRTWHGAADLGYSITEGNTTLRNLTLNLEPERRTEADRIRLKLQSLYSVQNRVSSGSLYKSQVRYDRFLGPRAFAFAIGLMERDGRELLNLRTSQGGGFGLRLRAGSDTHLSFFVGATFLQESFKARSRRLGAEALTGFEMQTKALAPFSISTKSQLLPILTEDRYRVEWDANVRVPLFAGLTFGIQLFDYFDSDPPRRGVKRNDFGLLSTLGLTF